MKTKSKKNDDNPTFIRKSERLKGKKTLNGEVRNPRGSGKSIETAKKKSNGRNVSIRKELSNPAEKKVVKREENRQIDSKKISKTETNYRNTRSKSSLNVKDMSTLVRRSKRIGGKEQTKVQIHDEFKIEEGSCSSMSNKCFVPENRQCNQISEPMLDLNANIKKSASAVKSNNNQLVKLNVFSKGEICFAKLTGHCTWPAKVCFNLFASITE